MKTRLTLLALVSAFALMPVLHAAEDAAPKKMGPKAPPTELADKMEKLQGAFRKLRKVDPATKQAQIADASKNEDSLKQIAIMKEYATAAAKLEPALKAQKPTEEQAKFVAAFRDQMKGFLTDINQLEAAVKAGKNDEAAKLVEKLNDDQKKGHTDFQPPRRKKS
jgi:hypothetical protein